MNNKKTPWKGVPQEFEKQWRKTFATSQEGLNLAEPCPVCGKTELHQYYQKPQTTRIRSFGALWEWCSACHCYEHYSVIVPDWWKPPGLDFDTAKLTAEPEAIDNAIHNLKKPGI